MANAFVPLLLALFVADLSRVSWLPLVLALVAMAVVSTFLGLFVAVSVSEVFEAQTFSNFFRFPMIFLCGLFFPIESLPVYLRPLSYLLPLTYGVDILHGAINGLNTMPLGLDFVVIGAFSIVLFRVSLKGINRKWIA